MLIPARFKYWAYQKKCWTFSCFYKKTIIFRYDLVLDCQEENPVIISGFKTQIVEFLPEGFEEYTDAGLTEVFFGKEVSAYIKSSDYAEKKPNICKLSIVDMEWKKRRDSREK